MSVIRAANRRTRALYGVLCATLAVLPLALLLCTLRAMLHQGAAQFDFLLHFLLYALLGGILTFGVSVAVGVPLYLYRARLRRPALLEAMLAGAIVGALVFLPRLAFVYGNETFGALRLEAVGSVFSGVYAAVAFWLGAERISAATQRRR